MRLLVIEDEDNFTIALYRTLAPQYQVDMAKSGMGAIQKTEQNSYDVILLDLHLPDVNGLKVCEYLRSHGVATPIIVISGEAGIGHKVALLEAGANDYVTKPCSMAELQARIRVAINNKTNSVKPVKLSYGDLELHTETRIVKRQGIIIELRRKEFAILECLMAHAGLVVSRDSIIEHAWQDDFADRNTLDVHIKSLRDKIDRPFEAKLIKTVHGVGFRLDLSTDTAKQYLVKSTSYVPQKSLLETTI